MSHQWRGRGSQFVNRQQIPSLALPLLINWNVCAIFSPCTNLSFKFVQSFSDLKASLADLPYGASLGLAMAKYRKSFLFSTSPFEST